MYRGGHPIERAPLEGGEVLSQGGYKPHPADGVDKRTLPFATGQYRNISTGNCDYQRIFPSTSWSSGSQVLVFEAPALQGQAGSMIDLRTSKIIVTFSAAGLSQDHTPAYMAGLLFASDVRMYLNGRQVTPSYQSLAPFAALHKAMIRRRHCPYPIVATDEASSDALNHTSAIGDLLDGADDLCFSPWCPMSGTGSSWENANSFPWTYGQYRWRQKLGTTTFQVSLPLDLLFPLADQPNFLPSDIVSLRLEITPCNATFSTMITNPAYALTNPTAQLWLRRVRLYAAGLSMTQAALNAAGKYMYGFLTPQIYSNIIPMGATNFRTTLLASGSRPQWCTIQFVSPLALNLSTWSADDGGVNRFHPFQLNPATHKAPVSSLVVRFGAERFPAYFDIARENGGTWGTGFGTAPLEYQSYKESCLAISESDNQETAVAPFMGSVAYQSGFFNVYHVNLTSNQQSVENRVRSAEKANLSVDISFHAGMLADTAIVITMMSNEVCEISKTGDVGVSF